MGLCVFILTIYLAVIVRIYVFYLIVIIKSDTFVIVQDEVMKQWSLLFGDRVIRAKWLQLFVFRKLYVLCVLYQAIDNYGMDVFALPSADETTFIWSANFPIQKLISKHGCNDLYTNMYIVLMYTKFMEAVIPQCMNIYLPLLSDKHP